MADGNDQQQDQQNHPTIRAARLGVIGTVAAAIVSWGLTHIQTPFGSKDAKIDIVVQSDDAPYAPVEDAEVDVDVPGVAETFTDSEGTSTLTLQLPTDTHNVMFTIRRDHVEVYRRLLAVHRGENSFHFHVPRAKVQSSLGGPKLAQKAFHARNDGAATVE